MSDRDRGEEVGRFEERLREWGRRPPAVAAAAARTRVTANLPEPSRPLPWLRLIAAASLLVVLAVAVWRASPRPAGEGRARGAVVAPAPVDPNVVVWVLDARTTVYFVLSRDGSEDRGVS